jgi:toxin-antitoxin system PIN domain toxin
MAGLLDVNVLVALVVDDHVHHQRAKEWLVRDGSMSGWATCLVAELGAIRVCAQLPASRWPPARTSHRVRLLKRRPGYRWAIDPGSPAKMREIRAATTGAQVSDRYLLGFARRRRARLVTFDRAIKAFGGEDVVCLSPERRRRRRD